MRLIPCSAARRFARGDAITRPPVEATGRDCGGATGAGVATGGGGGGGVVGGVGRGLGSAAGEGGLAASEEEGEAGASDG